MNLDYIHLMPEGFDPNSKVWIYQCSRMFGIIEAIKIEETLENFVADWKSHGAPVKGFATALYGQFIILMADESFTTVGGCSTDSSVHVIKEIEKMTGVQMFNRELLAFWVKDKVQTIPMAQVAYALENGMLQKYTLYFNNLVANKAEMETKWMQPISESWLGKKYIQ